MADEPQELRRVNWREVFGFTHIFGSFRLSRHMTKLVIAVAAVVLTWGLGNVLDVVFSVGPGLYVQGDDKGIMTEADAYWCVADLKAWKKAAKDGVQDRLCGMAKGALVGEGRPYDKAEKAEDAAKKSPGKAIGQLRERAADELKEEVKKTKSALEDANKAAKEEKDEDKQKDLKKKAAEAYDARIRAANQDYIGKLRLLDLHRKQDLFDTFVDYESFYFRQALQGVLHGDVFTGFNTIRQRKAQAPDGPPVQGRIEAGQPGQDPLGLLASLALMGYGILWLAAEHWVYALCFFLPLLAIWSLAGGAIARAAALQATRDEKAGVMECVKFSLHKVVSFVASPLAPIVVFLVVGVLTSLLPAILGWIPWFGPVWIGIVFGLVLIASVLMAFLLIGLLAGGLLMAPTIAVEGSDTFDACTRSYQFVLARPWRAALYGLVAAAYGAICYFFVRFLLFLVLLIAHWVTGILYFRGGDMAREGASRWDLIWPSPTFDNFHTGNILPTGLAEGAFGSGEWLGAWMIYLWVALVGAFLVAWVVSYIISASTYIYLLLRQAEDATDMDEVYVEEPAEEPPATATAPAEQQPAGAATASAPPAPPAPPATPPPADQPPPPPATSGT